MINRDHRIALLAAVSGAAGSLILLIGDMMFYGAWGEAGNFDILAVMARRTPDTLLASAAIGPLGGMLLAFGMVGVFVMLNRASKVWAMVAAGLLAVLGLVIGCYHLAYAFLGISQHLASPVDQAMLLGNVRKLLGWLGTAMSATGLVATIIVIALGLRRASHMPIWLLLLLPTLTSLIASAAPNLLLGLPAPWGAVVRGGWDNACFLVFFAAATMHLMATRPAAPADQC